MGFVITISKNPITVPTAAPTTGTRDVTQIKTEIISAFGNLNIVIPMKQRVPKITDSKS